MTSYDLTRTPAPAYRASALDGPSGRAELQTGLAAFQKSLADYLRDPAHRPRPHGVSADQGGLYRDLLLNGVCDVIDRGFPVARTLISTQRWRRLCRTFYRDWSAQTPIVAQLPGEFVQYVASDVCRQPLPRWFSALLHYEWMMLVVEMSPVVADRCPPDVAVGDWWVNGTVQCLSYDWPVHQITPQARPRRMSPVSLLIFRHPETDQVILMEATPLSAALLQRLSARPQAAHALLKAWAEALGWADPAAFIAGGEALIQQLAQAGALFQAGPDFKSPKGAGLGGEDS